MSAVSNLLSLSSIPKYAHTATATPAIIDIKTNTYRKTKKGVSLEDKAKGTYKIYRAPTKLQKELGIKLFMIDYETS